MGEGDARGSVTATMKALKSLCACVSVLVLARGMFGREENALWRSLGVEQIQKTPFLIGETYQMDEEKEFWEDELISSSDERIHDDDEPPSENTTQIPNTNPPLSVRITLSPASPPVNSEERSSEQNQIEPPSRGNGKQNFGRRPEIVSSTTSPSNGFLAWRRKGIGNVDLSPEGRVGRFPSVEERIMFYMSSWYAPACPEKLIRINKINSTTMEVLGPGGLPTHDTTTNMTIDTTPICHKIFAVERPNLETCIQSGRGNIKETYCPELLKHILPLYKSTATGTSPPLLIQVGDMMMTLQPEDSGRPQWMYTTIPHLGKTRYTWKDEDWNLIRFRKACDPRPTINGHLEPIIWKLNRRRHYPEMLNQLLVDEDIPWSQKTSGSVFRGIPSGIADTRLPPRQRCEGNPRCRLALVAKNSSIVDAKLVSLISRKTGRFNDLLEKEPLIEGEMLSMSDQLKFKGVIMVQGNDVATGLKWALLSNSVVLMAKPTVSSWLMEEWLEPFVHVSSLLDLVCS